MTCIKFDLQSIDVTDVTFAGLNNISIYDNSRYTTSSYYGGHSGLWRPIKISPGTSPPVYAEPLTFSKADKSSSFFPCNCKDTAFSEFDLDYLKKIENSTINCSYCTRPSDTVTWQLKDNSNNLSRNIMGSTCCDGLCDTRMNLDDYLPKIPMLNQSMLSGFVDHKYMKEFPGTNNPGLGIERYIKLDKATIERKYPIKLNNCDMHIDWKLKECISEEPYNPLTSQHINQYVHEKTYNRSLITSKTCGNFICLNGELSLQTMPKVEDFTSPYGFNRSTYNNLFINGKKIGSYWKWTYLSGVQCWQRYFNEKYETYISDGDIFYATLDGPEPYVYTENSISSPNSEEQNNQPNPLDPNYGADDPSTGNTSSLPLQLCPSGLKIINADGTDVYVVTSGTRFLYVSNNIYPLFLDLLNRIDAAVTGDNRFFEAVDIAATLATGPQYDNVSLDLIGIDLPYRDRNEFLQASGFNAKMNMDTYYGSAFNMNFIKANDTISKVRNLKHKYGQYVWIPPRTTASIELTEAYNGFIELDYDMVINTSNNTYTNSNAVSDPPSSSPLSSKCFAYKHKIECGSDIVMSIDPFDNLSYQAIRTCTVATGLDPDTNQPIKWPEFEVTEGGNFYSMVLNDNVRYVPASSNEFFDKYPRAVLPGEAVVRYCNECDSKSSYYLANSGLTLCSVDRFCDKTLANKYRGGRLARNISDNSLEMKRKYYAQAANPRIDAIAIHPNYGAAVQSEMFGLDHKKAVFSINNSAKSSVRNGTIKLEFTTYDVGIKIYNIRHTELQTASQTTCKCKRFPVDYNNLCKCQPIKSQYTEYNFYGAGSRTFRNKAYIPNLSTNFSPNLYQYGGFPQNYLNYNFPGKDLTTSNNYLENLPTRINPEYPDGRSSSVKSISLPNYHSTEWSFNTQANNIAVSENADLYGQSYIYFENEFGEDDERMNTSWKRYTTKVTAGSVVLWNGQSTDITPGSITIKLSNPMLSALTDGPKILHPPNVTGANYFFDNKWGLFGPRGDEMSSVTLHFSKKQQKHLLIFSGSPILGSNMSLEPCMFSVKEGLVPSNTNYSHINISGSLNLIDAALNIAPNQDSKTLCFRGTINNNLSNTLTNIYNIDHKKNPAIYILYNNTWYQYVDDITKPFPYKLSSDLSKSYNGIPNIYEYVPTKNSKKIPYMIPIYKKYQPVLKARYNSWTPSYKLQANATTYTSPPAGTPQLPPKLNTYDIYNIPIKQNNLTVNSVQLIIPGIRHYFAIKGYQKVYTVPISVSSVPNTSLLPQGLRPRDIVKFTDGYYIYIGGNYSDNDKYTIQNYLYLPDENIGRLFTNFTNLNIDFTKQIGNKILNTKETYEPNTAHIIKIYNKYNDVVLSRKILSRELGIDYYDFAGKPSKKNKRGVNFKLYTLLTIDAALPQLLDGNQYFIDSINSVSNTSLVVYNPSKFVFHQDKNLQLPNIMYGDLKDYDDNLFNDPIIYNLDLNSLPLDNPKYFNNFYKLIVGDLTGRNVSFSISNPSFQTTISAPAKDIQYNILQKYALDEVENNEKFYISDIKNYENYFPAVDINIFNKTFNNQDPNFEYDITCSNLWSDQTTEEFLNTFFLNLNKQAYLVPLPGANLSETFYIRKTPFFLKSIKKHNDFSEPAQTLAASKTFNGLYNNGPSLGVIRERDYPFIAYPIYDIPSVCSGDLLDRGCNAKPAGFINLKTEISYENTDSFSNTLSVSNLIGKSINVAFAYDDGLCKNLTTANNYYTTIKRTIDSDNLSLCSSPASHFLPQFIYDQKQDPAYWSSLGYAPVLTDLVTKTDKYANEILFRILYGEQQIYNRERLFFEEEALTYEKVSDSNYEITAKDIYQDIPYNYDRSATMNNLYLDHTISIMGTGGNGEVVTVKIGGYTITTTFSFDNSTHGGIVAISGPSVNDSNNFSYRGGGSFKYGYVSYPTGYFENNNLTVPDNLQLLGQITTISNTSWGYYSYRHYTGDVHLGVCGGCGPASPPGPCVAHGDLDPPLYHVNSTTHEIDYPCEGTQNWGSKLVPVLHPGTPYECEDGSFWQPPGYASCGNYGYGSVVGSQGGGGCSELQTWTPGETKHYYFENCRTAFNLTASIGSSTSSTAPDNYVAPSVTYNIQDSCESESPFLVIMPYGYRNCGSSQNFLTNLAPNASRSVINQLGDIIEEWEGGNRDLSSYLNESAEGCPGARTPGFDECAIISLGEGEDPVDVYQTTTNYGSTYEAPLCPFGLLTINYTTDSITIIAGNFKRCYNIPYKAECQITEITLPNGDYYFSETIDSECDSDKSVPSLTLNNNGYQNFQTVEKTMSYPIASISVCDINSGPLIHIGYAQGNIWDCPTFTPSHYPHLYGICGGGKPISAPDGIEDTHGLGSTILNEFTNRVSSIMNTLNLRGSIHDGSNLQAAIGRWIGGTDYGPNDKLLRGPTGGATLGYNTTEKNIPTSNGTVIQTTLTAYITIPYRVPLSVPAAIADAGYAVCGNNFDYNHIHEYPTWYGDLIGARHFDEITQEQWQPNVLAKNFVIMNSDFELTCDGLNSRYNKKILDDSMWIRPCGADDYDCWLRQGWTETKGINWR